MSGVRSEPEDATHLNMAFTDVLRTFTRSRRLLSALDRIATAQTQQAHQLQRLADHFLGPEVADPSPEDVKVHTGISYTRDHEQARILDYIASVHSALGRDPTEEEVLAFLEGSPV